MILAVAIWIGSQFPAMILMNLPEPTNIIMSVFIQILIVSGAVHLYSKYILKTDMRDSRIAIGLFSPGWLAAAILISLIFLLLFVITVPGAFQSIKHTPGETALLLIEDFIGAALGAAITEEIIFRGFCMRYIERRMGLLPAIIIPSFVFGALHFIMGDNMGISDTLLLIISGTLVGVMFSVITYYSDSIWPAVLVHGVWNFRPTFFGISSESQQSCLWLYQIDSRSKLLSGGSFGVESSLAAMLIYFTVILFILFLNSKKHPPLSAKHNTTPGSQ